MLGWSYVLFSLDKMRPAGIPKSAKKSGILLLSFINCVQFS